MTNTTLLLEILCALFLASFTSYVGGRVHQWRRQYEERNIAFREGFLRASTTLVTMAANGQNIAPRATSAGAPPAAEVARPIGNAGLKRTRIFFGQK